MALRKKAKINNLLGRNFKRERIKDRLSVKKRSELMSKIKSSNTVFEQKFISELKKRTRVKFELNASDVRGRPDIVFKKKKICIFLDSDFWHGWQYPRWKNTLKDDFWRNKIERNRKRDRNVNQYLKRNGWKVMRFWEHDIKRDLSGALNAAVSLILE